jgi:hypothetical protein
MRTLPATLAVSGVIALALVGAVASPASAATLPDTERLVEIDWEGNFSSIDPIVTLEPDFVPVTALYSAPAAVESAGADYNALDGTIYVLSPYDGDPCTLVAVDPANGSVISSTPISLTGEGTFDTCRAFTITEDGIAYASLDDVNLYTIDLSTAVATLVGEVTGIPDDIVGMAANPVDGKLYISADDIYEVDPTTAVATLVPGTEGLGDNGGVDFDANGVLWGTDWQTLFSLSISDPAGTYEAFGLLEEGTEALFIMGPATPVVTPTETPTVTATPALAATGFDGAPLGLAAGALALGLVAFIGARSRKARAQERA